MKKTLFILSSLNKGGIENYIIQLAEVFKNRGEGVIILSLSNKFDEDLLERVSKYAKILTLKEISNNYFLPDRATFNTLFGLNNRKIGENLLGVTRILAPGSYPMVIAKFIAAELGNCTYVAGVYHRNEFLWQASSYHRRVEKILFKELLKDGRVHVYGQNLLKELLDEYRITSSDVNTFPIGIKLHKEGKLLGDGDSKKIVILGRFVEFKTYIKGMIKNFKQILIEQPECTLEIYGYGPSKDEYIDLIKSLELSAYIKIKPSVSFDDMKFIFAGAFCAVGSGTTILHSSSFGIPSIIGIDSNPCFTSPGLFSDAALDSYNEIASYSDDELKGINCIIKSLFKLNKDNYRAVCKKHISIIDSYDIERNYDDFGVLFSVERSDEIKISLIRYAWSFLLSRGGGAFGNRFDNSGV